MKSIIRTAVFAATFSCAAPAFADQSFTLEQVLSYPFVDGIVSADRADRIAWMADVNGVRNIWMAEGPGFAPHQVTHYTADDGQEITQITFSPNGKYLIYVRGGDHDANWPAEGDIAPDPTASTDQAEVTIWQASLTGGAPVKVAEGDGPALSDDGRVAYVVKDQVWLTHLGGKGKPALLFFDRGKDKDLHWSPDGKRLAFVSDRKDHSFIGVFDAKNTPIQFLSPSTGRDAMPRWSPDGSRIAFARQTGVGGPPVPILTLTPAPWSIWVADASSGVAHSVWQSPDTLLGSWPETAGEANLNWAAGDRLVFLADLDNWPHLYSVPAAGGGAVLLTPGKFMVEHVAETRDRAAMIFSANTGADSNDDDRRHLFRVSVGKPDMTPITSGSNLEWEPVAASATQVAYLAAGPRKPPYAAIAGLDGKDARELPAAQAPKDFPESALVVPQKVTFRSPDGLTIHGQLFARNGGAGLKPGVIFVHGGPPRQMLLGWHYMDYYSNAYAVNQYLAAHGFVVLSVNYRLGIGYGHAFHHPEHAGPTGASEYQDVLAGAHYLQTVKGVDAKRIGIWGGSYGGYLTGLALARNSDVFKAGSDMHGLHDWSRELAEWFGDPGKRYEQGDWQQALKVAFDSSPDASIGTWKSPVLLIQGDDDRNVHFAQMEDLVPRLQAHDIPYEELVIPDEIHGFLRHVSWLEADTATADFLTRKLGAK